MSLLLFWRFLEEFRSDQSKLFLYASALSVNKEPLPISLQEISEL